MIRKKKKYVYEKFKIDNIIELINPLNLHNSCNALAFIVLLRCEIVEVEACGHTALMGNICCDCGVLLREEDLPKTEAVSMLHSVPDLKISRGVSIFTILKIIHY